MLWWSRLTALHGWKGVRPAQNASEEDAWADIRSMTSHPLAFGASPLRRHVVGVAMAIVRSIDGVRVVLVPKIAVACVLLHCVALLPVRMSVLWNHLAGLVLSVHLLERPLCSVLQWKARFWSL